MIALLKKEFRLCLHPTAFIFLAFAALVFAPNYPYEVIFFFSGLSVFFICLTGRENGDCAFSCQMPIKKSLVPKSRILLVIIFQCALLSLTAITVTVKEIAYPLNMQVNMAGNAANVAFLGYGALILGVFNVIFFPLHYKNPKKIGVPFVLASAAEFLIIGLLLILRWTVPLFRDKLNAPDPNYIGIKCAILAIGVFLYALFTYLSAALSGKEYEKVDF